MTETVTIEDALDLLDQGITWLINDGQCVRVDASGENFLEGMAAACANNIVDFFGGTEDVSRMAIERFTERVAIYGTACLRERRGASETESDPVALQSCEAE